jgi:uncharacterized protein
MTTILYHANCKDGFGAAWAAYQHFGATAQYIPVNYGEPIPKIEDGDDVFIVDFSYSKDILLPLAERCNLKVIDHHKTAFEALTGLNFATFDMNKSGAVLTWEYFFPDREAPNLLLYIQDRDLWRWNMPCSKEFSASLNSWPVTFQDWDSIAKNIKNGADFDIFLQEGKAILRHINGVVENKTKQAIIKEWKGFVNVATMNLTEYISETCHNILQVTEASFVATYFDAEDKRIWSLRSRGDVDVSAIAKQFGGGGHKAAAGFSESIRNP